MQRVKDFLSSAKKAIAGGLAAAAAAAGITWSELNWRELLIAFVVGIVGVYVAPRNQTGTVADDPA